MIIDKNITALTILDQESIRTALKKIDSNERGLLVCTDHSGKLLGILTDGDFRRWVVKQTSPDLDQNVSNIIKSNCIVARINEKKDKILSLINDRIKFIPLVDSNGRLAAIARRRDSHFNIDGRNVGPGHPTYIIAEIGNNHNGSFDIACRLVDKAIDAGADSVKFQLRDLKALYANAGDKLDASEDLGSQYTLDLLSKFQLTNKALLNVFDYCKANGITPLCTPWDLESLAVLEQYGMSAYKVASADFTNHDLLKALAYTGKPLICSTGMTTSDDIKESVSLLQDMGAQYILLNCNSTYPAPFKDINLRFMNVLKDIGNCSVGYSSHERGINVAIAAVSLGASIIEKHFTLDRNMPGNDHRVSLLPRDFALMTEGIRQVESALGGSEFRVLSQGELMNRETLGKSLWINVDLKAGEIIREEMIEVKSPGKGLQPNMKNTLVGKLAVRNLKTGDIFYPSDIAENFSQPKKYSFSLPFGIPVRYHDFSSLNSVSNFDILEFHLSYKDLELTVGEFFDRKLDIDLLVHSPELFAGDHVMDLCSRNKIYRAESIENLKQVVKVTRSLRAYFPHSKTPKIILNVGGFTPDKPMDVSERYERYEMVTDAFSQVDLNDVEILPQTMPPFPWHFGGQRIHNLFVDPNEIVLFCKKNNYRVCFDVSHSKLACNHNKWSFSEFVQKVTPYSAHVHIADASGVDGEGLQIGEGEIDFSTLGRDLITLAPAASFIPEVWQGHKNNGEGFWVALNRLEGLV